MEARQERSAHVSFLRGAPATRLVSLFKQAFPQHPASLLNDSLTGAFLSAFAQRGTFLVAYDPVTQAEIGFAIAGDAAVLDRTRGEFIRKHGWHLAGSLLRRRLSPRVLFARIRIRKPVRKAVHSPYQLRFIAIDPRARGMGVGTMLLEALEKTLPLGTTYHAWTLEGPGGAEGFYLANGFHRGPNINGHLRMWKRLTA